MAPNIPTIDRSSFESLAEDEENIARFSRMNPWELTAFFKYLHDSDQLEQFLELGGDSVSDFHIPLWSYYERYLPEFHRKALDNVAMHHLPCARDDTDLPLALNRRFDDQELDLIFGQTSNVQFSFGCSGCCQKCGADATPGVRERSDVDLVKKMIERWAQCFSKNKTVFYFASDPRDLPGYTELHAFIKEVCGYDPLVTTKVSDDEESMEWIQALASVCDNFRLSLFHILDLDEILDFKLKIHEAIGKFPEIAGDHDQLLDFFGGKDFPYEGHLDGIGTRFAGSTINMAKRLTGGVLLTPRGLYNRVDIPMVTESFPQGHILTPIIELDRDFEPKTGDFLPELLTRCVVRKNTKANPCRPDLGLVPKEEPPISVILVSIGQCFSVSFKSDGIVTEVMPISIPLNAYGDGRSPGRPSLPH